MTPTLAHIADRVRRLADTLSELRVRVGRAVTTEVSRAVGEAARDLVAVALGERTTPSSPWRTATTSGHWAGDADDEYDAFHDGDDRYDAFDDEPEASFPYRDVPPSPSWPAAVAVGAAAARCWAARTVPAWVAAGTTVLAVAAAAVGGPLARSVLAAVTAAGELLPLVLDPD